MLLPTSIAVGMLKPTAVFEDGTAAPASFKPDARAFAFGCSAVDSLARGFTEALRGFEVELAFLLSFAVIVFLPCMLLDLATLLGVVFVDTFALVSLRLDLVGVEVCEPGFVEFPGFALDLEAEAGDALPLTGVCLPLALFGLCLPCFLRPVSRLAPSSTTSTSSISMFSSPAKGSSSSAPKSEVS